MTPDLRAVPTVQIDEAAVRVTEWRFAPGAVIDWHRHEYPYVGVPMTTGQPAIKGRDGATTAELGGGRSHAFLTPKHHLLYPDVEADRAMYEWLRAGDYQAWRHTSLGAIEDSGQQEMLNWMCLVGAMAELDRRPTDIDLIETYIFNSSKCFAFFPPPARG